MAGGVKAKISKKREAYASLFFITGYYRTWPLPRMMY